MFATLCWDVFYKLARRNVFETQSCVENVQAGHLFTASQLWFDLFISLTALLELNQPVQFDANIYPICLPTNALTLTPGRLCYITGWGRTGWKGTRARNLRQAAVPLISRDQCNKEDSYNGEVHKTSLCAGFEYGSADACQSDSGGPLSCQESGRWYIAGVISWGKKCAQPHKFGVYANVQKLKPWIIDTIFYEK